MQMELFQLQPVQTVMPNILLILRETQPGENRTRRSITSKHFKKMVFYMKNILLIIATLYFPGNCAIAQTNGYTLEFEDVVTLSVDSLLTPPVGTVITKSYTVPSGMVLKINSGRISRFRQNNITGVLAGFIKVNDNLIIGADTSMPGLLASGTGAYSGSVYHLRPDQPIWAPSNSVVTLGVSVGAVISLTSYPLFSNWFSGVLFRKVPN